MNLSPGPANFYVMARTIAQGVYAGLAAVAGLAVGGLVHVVAAVLGLSVLFTYSPLAYTLLKLIGASYLIYLGLGYFGINFLQKKDKLVGKVNETTQENLIDLKMKKSLFKASLSR